MRINFTPPNSDQPKTNTANTQPPATEAAPPSKGQETAPILPDNESSETVSQRPPARAAIDRAVNIEEVVKAFQLPDTPAVRGLIAEMARGGIELSHENINILSQAAEAFTELKAEQIVFMAREEILINPENVERFQQFLTHKNLIGEQLANILEQLPEQFSTTMRATPGGFAAAPSAGGSEISGAMPQAAAESPEMSYKNVSHETFLSSTNPENITEGNRPATTLLQPQFPTGGVAQSTVVVVGDANPDSSQQPISAAPTPDNPQQSTANPIAAAPDTQSAPLQSGGLTPPLQSAMPPPVGDAHPGVLSGTQPPAASTAPPSAGGQEIVNQPPLGDDAHIIPPRSDTSQPALGDGILDVPHNPDTLTVEQKIISLFKKVDPHNPHRLTNELNARELARELAEVIDAVKQRLSELEPQQREVLTRTVNELEQSVRFLDTLNKFTPIINIPLQWGDERTTAELYVFNDSRGKKIDPQNATVFISLMTSNAGRVETMIKILGKSVECDFSLESDDVADAMRGGMHTLYKLLDVQGYRLARTSAQASEKVADIFDVSKIREQNKSRYFFDRKI